ncbi:MAG: ACP S-malonyltransferase [Chloroflexota bacterium]
MQVILSDHNCEGQSKAIFNVLRYDRTWLDLVPMQLLWFSHVGLSGETPDEEVWQFCQDRGYLLLTGNRTTTDGEASLEMSIQRLFQDDSLPVLTIGNLKRINSNPAYCRACAIRLAEIVDDLDNYRGTMRVYLG